ncbi:2,3-bisphosphoglycerate-independent phosphoglycerate mutase [Nanoarchaeota archaeon]
MKKPVVYIILDGWGVAPPGKGNAITLAKTPNMDKLQKNYPYTQIGAGGEAIGLWKGHQGSSEVGHFIIGAGRNVYLPQGIIANAVESGEIFNNKAYLDAMNYVKEKNSTLHLAGLMSDKGVHNYDIAVHALIEMAAKNGIKDVVIHFFSDGRDTEPYDAKKYLDRLEKAIKKFGVGKIGTVMGRYWIMDRDHRWDRLEKGYNAMVNGDAEFKVQSAAEAIENSYQRGYNAKKKGEDFIESDEFIKPTVIVDDKNEPVGKIEDNDALIWINFRTDRAIEISQAFVEDKFDKFDRGKKLDIHYVCTFEYYKGVPAPVAFERVFPKNTFGEMISKAGLKQYRVTETEKWIYVTTVFSGMREDPFPGEDRLLIQSDKIPTYDLKPRMHALDIVNAAVEAINSDKYELIFLNLNNPDIIGHTGNINAVIEGVEECDKGVGILVDAVRKKNGLVVISADHGNAEIMLTEEGKPHTHHTASDVPFIIIDDDPKYKNCKLRSGGGIKDVTPTILEILDIEKPKEMTGESLIVKE